MTGNYSYNSQWPQVVSLELYLMSQTRRLACKSKTQMKFRKIVSFVHYKHNRASVEKYTNIEFQLQMHSFQK